MISALLAVFAAGLAWAWSPQVIGSGGSPARLVEDINPGPTDPLGDSSPARFLAGGGIVYFTAQDRAHSRELWKTDGTAEGTVLVEDVSPGGRQSIPGSRLSSAPVPGAVIEPGDILIFAADVSDDVGSELWRSDGTPEGTVLLKDINPGLPGSSPEEFIALNGFVFFTAVGRDADRNLWRTDGSEAGTVRLTDLRFVRSLAPFQSMVYFNGESGLWRSDGTVAGTQPLGGPAVDPRHLTTANGSLFFSGRDIDSGRELWKTDGTAAGTVLVRDILPGPASSLDPRTPLIEAGGAVYFPAFDGVTGVELWTSDGTEAGTELVKDINPSGSALRDRDTLVASGGRLFFQANDGTSGRELWVTDGTGAGTRRTLDILPGPGSSIDIRSSAPAVAFLDGVVFAADDGVHGRELWRSDGTESGTALVKDVHPSGSGFPIGFTPQLFVSDGLVLFGADDGIHGRELWRSDGTGAGTVLVEDINPGDAVSADPFLFTSAGESLFFTADDGASGFEIWASNGTEEGTNLTVDLLPGPGSSVLPLPGYKIGFIPEVCPLGDRLMFPADDGISGFEPRITDGTPAGTRLLMEINPGPGRGTPFLNHLAYCASVNDEVWFIGWDGRTTSYWKTDGTAEGTRPFADITDAFPFTPVIWHTVFGNELYFVKEDDVQPFEGTIWKTDGTAGGTVPVAAIGQGFGCSNNPVAAGALLFFVKGDDLCRSGFCCDNELWRTDGTTAGTFRVRDIYPGEESAFPELDQSFRVRDWTALGDRLMFSADDGIHGRELWSSDGTAIGTRLVMDLFPGPDSSIPFQTSAAVIGGEMLFAARDGVHGHELWKTDGSAAGTVLVKDIYPGPVGSRPQNLEVVGNRVVFAASDGIAGVEWWVSDGTEEGTVLVQDLAPGPYSSNPSDFTWAAGRLFFSADVVQGGLEMWATDPPIIEGRARRNRRLFRIEP